MEQQVCVSKSPYRGDVSALCLVSSPERQLLLAGTGPQVLLYDLITGELLSSHYAFDGVRVHGIYCGPAFWMEECSSTSRAFRNSTVVIHGERSIKLFKMVWHAKEEAPQLHILGSLPRFSYWVLDVRFLQEEEMKGKQSPTAGAEDVQLLAVGLSNNSIFIWDLLNSAFTYHVECSERCLLYSMRLWGDSLETLLIAAGTVFNEVLVWKLGSNLSAVRHASTILTELGNNKSSTEHQGGKDNVQDTVTVRFPQFVVEEEVDPLHRITGHEGSIHRLMWSSDGLTLVSVSDDRSARVWCIKREKTRDGLRLTGVEAGPVLYGHVSRLWDCYVGEKLLITASEDCTCLVWTANGKYLATLKGHIGRGIWRCIYDPELNTLVTGGADSSIKVQSLDKWVPRASTFQKDQGVDVPLQRDLQLFSISPLWSNVVGEGRPSGFMDSKSEYVRCLALSNPWSLYVSTNRGVVYHVNLRKSKDASWTLLVDDIEGPIVCMDVLVQGETGGPGGQDNFPNDDIVVVGNGRGKVSVMRVRRTAEQWHCEWHYSWAAEKERQLLGVYMCESIGGRLLAKAQAIIYSTTDPIRILTGALTSLISYIFTTDPRGRWRLWHTTERHIICSESFKNSSSSSSLMNLPHGSHDDCIVDAADLVAYGSGSDARILCIDVCPNLQLLVCGDKQGVLTAFSFPKDLLRWRVDCKNMATTTETEAPVQLPVVDIFKGAHGISAIAGVSIRRFKHSEQAEIISTGSDKCICSFLLDRHSSSSMLPPSQQLLCTGIEKVAALSVVESLNYCKGAIFQKGVERQIAAGFTGSDFLLWDLTYQCEVMRVTCGGWRRPHSVFVGNLPELEYCFVYVKDQAIQVQRNLVTSIAGGTDSSLRDTDYSGSSFSNKVSTMTMQSLRGQFHGKEISSVLFLRTARDSIAHEVSNPSSCSWIATGSEDGTVIISRYVKEMNEQLDPTSLLGDHVGGSAVKALALVAEVHLVNTGEPLISDVALTEGKRSLLGNSIANVGYQELLFSAGAKEVLTCWLLDWLPEVEGEEVPLGISGSLGKSSTSLNQETDLLKYRAPTSQWLSTHIPHNVRPRAKTAAEEKTVTSVTEIHKQENSKNHSTEQTISASRSNDDTHGDQRFLALTAFATRCAKTGILISFVATASSNATLHLYAWRVHHHSWIELAVLEYPAALVLTIEHFIAPCSSHGQGICDVYMILTGAAHGNIALWDVTNLVLEYSSFGGLCVNEAPVAPVRPLTGRGSQGGRHWKKTGKEHMASLKLKHSEEKNLGRGEGLGHDPLQFVSGSRNERELSDEIFRAGEETGRYNNTRPSFILEENVLFRPSTMQWPEGPTEPKLPSVQLPQQPAETKPSLVLNPLQELIAAHQSGVNCMSVARIPRVENWASSKMAYVVISGGDDQALHMAIFTLEVDDSNELLQTSAETVTDADVENAQQIKVNGIITWMPSMLQHLSQSSVPCAHNSAVKGVWTDGFWAFSTGLDQRLRCWRVTPNIDGSSASSESCEVDHSRHPKCASPLVECMTCVIDVPEAASLHVKDCCGGRYQIAVVGRGLQVINFDSNSLSC